MVACPGRQRLLPADGTGLRAGPRPAGLASFPGLGRLAVPVIHGNVTAGVS
jgi:hypothetical protein